METPICQVAMSVSDLERSCSWYEKLGFKPSGGMGPVSHEWAARMLDLPELDVRFNWLLGEESMTQLELFCYARPEPRPLPTDWSPRYAGYGIVGFVVSDFEAFPQRLRAMNERYEITGPLGSRSLWIKDPDGVALEILERDPLGSRHPGDGGELPSIRTISLTVVDLMRAKRFWTAAVGLTADSVTNHVFNDFPKSLDHGLNRWDEVRVKGGSVILRLLKPRDVNVIASKRRLSDIGLLNIAAIVDNARSYEALLQRIQTQGYSFTEPTMGSGEESGGKFGYDDQGNSFELGFVVPGAEGKFGWRRT